MKKSSTNRKRRSTTVMAAALSASLLISATVQAAAPQVGSQSPAASSNGAGWAAASMAEWAGYGVIQGFGDGALRPSGKVTRAELATIVNRIFGYYAKSGETFADIPSGAWYADALSIARQAGYYEGYPGNRSNASAKVTRQDAAVLMAKALRLVKNTSGSGLAFADAAQISPYARDAVEALGDVISGYPDGTFRPQGEITRAELVTVIDRLIAKYYYEAGSAVGGNIDGHAIINHSGAKLQDVSVSGNLYLAPGIADGEAVLQGVKVKGTAFILGGGDHSIHIEASELNHVVVDRAEGKVRIAVSGGSKLSSLMLHSLSDLIIEDGAALESLTVSSEASGSTVDIGKLTGELAITVLDGGSVIVNGQTVTSGGTYTFKEGQLQAGGGNSGTGAGSGSGNGGSGTTPPPAPSVPKVNLVDEHATAETKSLFAFLQETRGQAVLFGHQHDTTVSFAGKDGQGNVISDVKNDVGDYPAVFGWDTLSLDGRENPPGVAGDYEASRQGLTAAMKRAHELGGIVTLSTHPYNFATGGSFNDTSNTAGAVQSVVTRILPGGDKNDAFNQYLDRIANFANGLKDDSGELIPVLFRPFHEQNGSWFWWGAATTSKAEYVELYRYTVEYLRDVKQVRNFLYVYSPNGPFNGNENEYLTTYPGDDYVDILGMDQYDSKDNAGSDAFLGGLVKDLKMISQTADRKGKIATLSEYGFSAQGMKSSGNSELHWFTKIMNAIKGDPDAKRIAYMLTWANFDDERNLFVPYKDIAGKGSHELLPDFVDYYNDPYTSFAGELSGVNVYERILESAAEQPFLHIVSPTNVGTVSDSAAVIRANVLHASPAKVTYSIGDGGAETEMTVDARGYYAGAWKPEAELNGKSAMVTVRAYLADGTTLEQTISVFVKVREIEVKKLTFDTADSLSLVQNNGTYPSTIQMALAHTEAEGDGKLELQLSGLDAADTWQEFKLQLTQNALSGADLAQVQRLKLSALIPVSAGGAGAAVQSVAMYPEDWGFKYGESATKKTLADLEQVTVNGTDYYKYDAVIELHNAAAAAQASGLAISLVGSGMASSASEPISVLVDDVGLYNAYSAPILDTGLVDDYEGYGGSSDALAAKYPKAGGDDVSVSLSPDAKASGDYAMKLQFAVNTAGYTGVGKSLGTVNWSDSNALKLWVKTDSAGEFAKDGKPMKLVVQAMMNGTAYEAYPVLDPSKEYSLTIPFGDFEVASWSSGGPVTKEALKHVTNFNIYINAMDGGSHSGALYFDDIRAVHDDAVAELPDAAEQPGTPAGVLYGFDSAGDFAGWKLENNTAGAHDIGHDAAEGALTVEFPLVNTGKASSGAWNEEFELTLAPAGLNLSQLETLTADVKLSEGTAKARLFLKSGSGWTWVDSGAPIEIHSAGDTALSISLKDAANIAGVDLKDIKAIGIKVEELGNSGAAAKLFLKEVSLQAALPDAG